MQLHIGEIYRYRQSIDAEAAIVDGLPNFYHVTRTPGAPAALLAKGINRIAAHVAPDGHRIPAILIRSSPHKFGSETTPWADIFEGDRQRIRYAGDAKTPGMDPFSSPGNKALWEAFALHQSSVRSERLRGVPLLFFRGVPVGNRIKGNVVFEGFGIIADVHTRTETHPFTGHAFENLVFDFALFRLDDVRTFDWSWISARRNATLVLENTLGRAPRSWRDWLEDGSQDERLRGPHQYTTKARPL